ncbi:MAG: SRPBCC domain-containing protein [Bacteroidia bacterium]|nr:SRPBCC domain-containing protein [Bacteroidia bacterium]
MNNHTVKKEVKIKGTPYQVWEALVNPQLTKQYFFNCEVISDWKPGSDITFIRKFLWMKYELKGTVVDIHPGKLLKYTLKNTGKEGSQSESIVTDTITFANGMTKLTIEDNVGNTEGAEKRFNKSEKGWDKVLGGLKELIENKNMF